MHGSSAAIDHHHRWHSCTIFSKTTHENWMKCECNRRVLSQKPDQEPLCRRLAPDQTLLHNHQKLSQAGACNFLMPKPATLRSRNKRPRRSALNHAKCAPRAQMRIFYNNVHYLNHGQLQPGRHGFGNGRFARIVYEQIMRSKIVRMDHVEIASVWYGTTACFVARTK